jgi:hypothetical protein
MIPDYMYSGRTNASLLAQTGVRGRPINFFVAIYLTHSLTFMLKLMFFRYLLHLVCVQRQTCIPRLISDNSLVSGHACNAATAIYTFPDHYSYSDSSGMPGGSDLILHHQKFVGAAHAYSDSYIYLSIPLLLFSLQWYAITYKLLCD